MKTNYNSVSIILLFLFIGQRNLKVSGSASKIIGGNEAPVQYGDLFASLQNLDGQHVCGGAIISRRHVVTAAHCVQGAEPQFVKVVTGTTNLASGGTKYDVKSIVIHKGFDPNLRTNDIALIRISIKFNLRVSDILKLDMSGIEKDDPVVLMGFGATEANGDTSQLMHALNVTTFDQETCRYAMRYTREVYDHMFCTFTTVGQGTCYGDSGGPLVKGNQLVGLVSWGIPCAVGFPDVHTRIAHFVDWIHKEIRRSCECEK